MDLYEPVKLFKTSNRDTGQSIEQWNGLEDFNILNFSKFLLEFAIVFKIFECFIPFLSLTVITGWRSFSSLADGLHDITPETEYYFEHFDCEIWKLFF